MSYYSCLSYDKESDEGSNWVRQGDESESAKIVLMYIYDKQCGIMQNNQTFRFSVFTMGRQELCAENAQKTQKLGKLN